MPGPLCQILNPLNVEDGTLCRMPSPLPGPEGVGPESDDGEDADISGSDSELSVFFGQPEQDTEIAEDQVFWEVFDCDDDWPGSWIPREFMIRVSEQTFYMNEDATRDLLEYALNNFAGPGSFDEDVSFPISELASALGEAVDEEILEPLWSGEVEELGDADEPVEVGDWEFSFEYDDGIVEVTQAIYGPAGSA